jgi:hypothetical protein
MPAAEASAPARLDCVKGAAVTAPRRWLGCCYGARARLASRRANTGVTAMTFSLFAHKRATRIAAMAAGSLLIGGSAYAITSTTFTYPKTKNGYLAISHMAMVPAENSDTVDYGISPNNGLAATGPLCFTTGLNFPNGAKLVKASVWYSSAGTSDIKFLIYRKRFSDGDTDSVVDETTINDNTSTYKGKTALVDPFADIVENNKYAIGFNICVDDGDVFYGGRVHYTYTTAGD